jgi:segregation and condensation protein B
LRDRFYGRVRDARLSRAAVDVLAIVAYRQPVTARQIAELRGRPSGRLLAQLVRRRLLRVHRPAGPRAPAEYQTADRFLELFGLGSVDDLPQSEDLG